jgi:hypothetical protein
MKGTLNKMVLFAALIAGTGGLALAQDTTQDKSTSLDHAVQGYAFGSTRHIKWDLNLEPEFRMGNDTRITGLLVDAITPHYTSIMLNPPELVTKQEEVPPSLMPVAVPHSMHDPTAHEPDFVLLRLSFP